MNSIRSNRRDIWEMLDHLNTERGVTCILVTHNVHEAERVIHRVAVMHNGRFAALGTPGEIKNHLGGAVRLEFRLKDAEQSMCQSTHSRCLARSSESTPGNIDFYLPPDRIGAGVDTVLNQHWL